MKRFSLLSLEFRRLLKSRLTWLILLLTMVSPVLGLILYKPASAKTMLSMYLANPAIAGGAAGGLLFGFLTIYELNRTSQNRMEVLTDAVVSPLFMAKVRLAALLLTAALAAGITMTFWFPISRRLIGSVFDESDFFLSFLIFMAATLPLSVFSAAAACQFTRRADLSAVVFLAFSGLSLTVWAGYWQLSWLNPCVWALSDDFSNFRIFRSVSYMRLTWLLALSGAWILSYLSIRRYGLGFAASFCQNLRHIGRPAAAFVLLAAAAVSFVRQPMVDHENPDQTVTAFLELPWLENVVCTGRSAQVFPDTDAGTVSGRAVFRFQNASGQAQDAAFGINPGYAVTSVRANGREVPFSVSGYQEFNEAMLTAEIPAEAEVELTVEYGGFPKESCSLSAMQGRLEISQEYLCLENAALSPRLLNVMPDENLYPAAVEITLPKSMTVIPFRTGEARIILEHADGTATWRYEYNGTGGILYAGDYVRQDFEAGGLSIEFYYGRRHQAVMEAANASEAVQAVVSYCLEHYGLPSFGAGGSLKLVQSRVSGGGYATTGASLLDEADFTAANLSDTGKGAVPGEVMIHELVHQWWGLGCMFDASDPEGTWSAEGLTVYTTWRIVKELYGEAYAREHYVKQWQEAVEDYYLDFYVRNPEYLDMLPEEKKLLITEDLAYVRRYCEMPLKILKAETLVGGEAAMDQILFRLFNREPDPMAPYLTYEEFLDACGLREEDLNLA